MTVLITILAAVTLSGAVAAMTLRNLVHCALRSLAGLTSLAFAGLATLYLSLDASTRRHLPGPRVVATAPRAPLCRSHRHPDRLLLASTSAGSSSAMMALARLDARPAHRRHAGHGHLRRPADLHLQRTGYMEHDENFTRFFCFLALFAGAMLGVVIANSLLLLFMCWEIVGLTSYLLIGFWYTSPAPRRRQKSLHHHPHRRPRLPPRHGLALRADRHAALLRQRRRLPRHSARSPPRRADHLFGLTVSTAIGLLIFCGAAGKSGQVPLHVWLPDAMEGPTPVSALIHAATMVAAGVFLIARIYPLMSAGTRAADAHPPPRCRSSPGSAPSPPLRRTIAVAQFDIKRILAYSTVSQLGYMMMGLGVGGVAVGMFHLITHAFFKALLFLGAGSVIHGCSGEQDIRRMGGLRKLHAHHLRSPTPSACSRSAASRSSSPASGARTRSSTPPTLEHLARPPFYMGAFGALLTAFYMTRQVYYVFAGPSAPRMALVPILPRKCACRHAVQLLPRRILRPAGLSRDARPPPYRLPRPRPRLVLLRPQAHRLAERPDPLARLQPHTFSLLGHASTSTPSTPRPSSASTPGPHASPTGSTAGSGTALVQLVSYFVLGLAWLDNFFDTYVVKLRLRRSCRTVSRSGQLLSYLRIIGCALIALVLFLLWGAKA
jgi:hypothetical protein